MADERAGAGKRERVVVGRVDRPADVGDGESAPAIQEGAPVRATGNIPQVPVGDGMLGRVVNALGEPIDARRDAEALPVDRLRRAGCLVPDGIPEGATLRTERQPRIRGGVLGDERFLRRQRRAEERET